ncbi:hypothetical protein [Microvirga lotononidis]|uniref:Uncharacterized protein n=1 Tax=Microvirga lotononidis TaxID=864069 RepID=I4YVM8_9HYPH|nr:hypothetical protein [Microvirga lotononidis]EIM28020.1 hypothetical protein MicloDRAFT_00045970 [Microvirga lotononidis]WQO27867.1 hypothetical protein U0023_01790 [Microvirga lotononidis]
MTGPLLRLVANGLSGPRQARAVLLVFPDPNGKSGWDPFHWPTAAHPFIDSLLAGAKVELSGDIFKGLTPPTLTKPPLKTPNEQEVEDIEDLWQRSLLRSPKISAELFSVWTKTGVHSPPLRAHMPLPVAEAGLLLPLERARAALTMIAPDDSPLHKRTGLRPSSEKLNAMGRPWLGDPQPLVRFASANPDSLDDASRRILFGPPDVGAWLHGNEAGADLSDHPFSAPLNPDDIARRALGHGDEDLLSIFDRMHAFHYAALNGIQLAQNVPVPKAAEESEHEQSTGATRRLQQLLSSPALLRLFGFARDVLIDFGADIPNGVGTFEQVIFNVPFAFKRTAFESERDKGHFYPASRVTKGDTVRHGVRRIGVQENGKHRFTMVSIEPVTSIDEDIQANSNNRKAKVTTGPLALVDLYPQSFPPFAGSDVEYAEDLAAPAPNRLDVGIDTEDGKVAWYSASPRVIRYGDPRVPAGKSANWPQKMIERLTPDWLPAYERDAHGVAFSTFIQKPEIQANALQKDDQDKKKTAAVSCYDPRVATYGGEALGARSNPINIEGNKPRWGASPVWLSDSDLLLDQHVGVPDGDAGDLALRRFGWRYHFGIRRAFIGGAGITLDRARAIYEEDEDAAFPSASKNGSGFRYLRHDAITKPEVMLSPNVSVRPKPLDKLQTGQQMVLVSRKVKSGAEIRRTTRILVPQPVEPEFAAMHEAFDEVEGRGAVADQIAVPMPNTAAGDKGAPLATHAPRQGLRNLWLNHDDQHGTDKRSHRLKIGSGEIRATPYYPDPSACFIVLRLQHPHLDHWLGPPMAVRIRGDEVDERDFRWPDILPVMLELSAVTGTLGPQLSGGNIITENGQRFRHITASLAPGEAANLKVWFAPDAEDMLSWFDVIDRSVGLCTAEGKECECKPEVECAAGRLRLLGTLGVAMSAGLGSTDEERYRLAGLYHQRLLQEPNYLFADVADIKLVHTTDEPWTAAAFKGTPAVARPISLEEEPLNSFLATAGRASDWDDKVAEDNATAVIIGGEITFDQATTSSLSIEAQMLRPGDESLERAPPEVPAQFVPNEMTTIKYDKDTGKADFGKKVWTEILRIENIPMPEDGRAGPHDFRLEEVLAGRDPRMKGATVQYLAPLHHGQARQAQLRVVPTARHAAMISTKPARSSLQHPVTPAVWIPATIQPAAPDCKELIPCLAWEESSDIERGNVRAIKKRNTGFRLVLRRPWFSTGEGERVGVVLWPPPVLNLPFAKGQPPFNETEVPSDLALNMLTEEDLNPFGRLVSVWGGDPTKTAPRQRNAKHRFLSFKEFKLPKTAMLHPRVLMPIPASVSGQDKPTFVEVSVISFPVEFEEYATDAFVDIDIAPIMGVAEPLLRLGVVRLQINARHDTLPSLRGERSGIRCSPASVVEARLFPERVLSVSATAIGPEHGASEPRTSVSVVLSGPGSSSATGPSGTRVYIELKELIGDDEVAVASIKSGISQGDETRALTHAIAEGTGEKTDSVLYKHENGEDIWVASFILPGSIGSRTIVARAREVVLKKYALEDLRDPAELPRYFAEVKLSSTHPKQG